MLKRNQVLYVYFWCSNQPAKMCSQILRSFIIGLYRGALMLSCFSAMHLVKSGAWVNPTLTSKNEIFRRI